MGKGKGEPEYWAAVVKPGMILFEVGRRSRSGRPRVPGPRGLQDAVQVPIRRPAAEHLMPLASCDRSPTHIHDTQDE